MAAAKFDNDDKKKSFIKVFVRPRPFNKDEIERKYNSIVFCIANQDITLKGLNNREKRYSFEKVFRLNSSQNDVYMIIVHPLLESVICGINCTVIAYGQTGSGKTHTVCGSNIHEKSSFKLDDSAGLIPRSAYNLFEYLNSLKNLIYTVRISFIEIYNEELSDLLIEASSSNSVIKLYEDANSKVKITNITEVTVVDYIEVCKYLHLGSFRRHTASTNLNIKSSRSHSVFTITINTKEILKSGQEIIKYGKLNFVDLAGSENISRSGATDIRAKEAMNINKSLLTLNKVIISLAKKRIHVPYRESKLTRILQDSLGGNAKTTMIATISPSQSSWDETVSTLDYATITRGIENCPQVNENVCHSALIQELTTEIHELQKELDAARSGIGFYMTHEKYEKINEEMRENKEKTEQLVEAETSLSEKLQSLSKKLIQLQEENNNLTLSFEKTNLYRKNLKKELQLSIKKNKEDEFLLNHYQDCYARIKETTKQLINICTTSDEHDKLIRNKYNEIKVVSLKNATAAKEIVNLSTNTLDSLSLTIDEFFQNINLNEFSKINDAWKICKDQLLNDDKKCNETIDNTFNIEDNKNNIIQLIDNNFIDNLDDLHNQVLSKFNDNHSIFHYEITKTIQIIDEKNKSFINLLDEENKMDDILIDMLMKRKKQREIALKHLHIDQILDTINNLKNIYETNYEKYVSEVNKFKEYFQNTNNVRKDKTIDLFQVYLNDINDYIKNEYSTIDSLLKNLSTNTNDNIKYFENNLNNLNEFVEVIKMTEYEFSKNVRQYIEQCIIGIKEHYKNIQFTSDSGDTPVRQSFHYPNHLSDITPLREGRTKLSEIFQNDEENYLDNSIDDFLLPTRRNENDDIENNSEIN